MSYNSLENYFRTNFSLMQHHKYNLAEIEGMMPWERDVYIALLLAHLEEEKLQQQQLKANR
ncbi:MAG: hypothetical protein CMB98_05075 [Flavobacteriaceae bacterium]|jgi:hypothetical protein|nr:hypothetical protein [Flavobacteriaceae bacterium]|tara:strand:- start:305 stop:487 length:183 start_codon:yes stop_codon:yes gene_type:complete